MNSQLPRRAVLAGAALLGATSCAIPDPPPNRSEDTTTPERATQTPPVPGRGRVLLAYFSRAGENYFYGGRRDLRTGNTEVLATMITDLIDCDTYRIEASNPYPNGYHDTVQRNVAEQDFDARPAIADPLGSIDDYEHVLLGSPIWNTRPPMIMSTFAETYDFTGTTVHPFVTYAVSGLGSTERVYTEACQGAQVAAGLAVRGEEVSQHPGEVQTWLREAGLLT